MVSGGYKYNGTHYSFDSTEIFSNNVWRTVDGKLPRRMYSMVIATYNNKIQSYGKLYLFHFLIKKTSIPSGGYTLDGGAGALDSILEFNYETETWTEIGTLKAKRGWSGVSVVSYDDYENFCN